MGIGMLFLAFTTKETAGMELDSKKPNKGSTKYAPVVWKMTTGACVQKSGGIHMERKRNFNDG